MTNTRKKKYATGEGAQFMTRKAALKKLQVSLKHFRKLCILKGIYPREPRNRKRAQKGQTGIKTLYHVKDIQFLMHEPIIWKLRDYNIFARKVGRARALKDFKSMKRYLNNHPTLKLDHIVKERYPTFVDALRDLDDCLTLCFLFSTFPSLKHIPRDQSKLCRRLTVEFMHAVIEAKALRKVFISIKGYYYQAEIKGVSVNWITPHHFSFTPQAKEEVDFRIMSTFVDFYTVMLGFVNFRLYHDLNIHYPPSFQGISGASETDLVDEEVYVAERVSALNLPLAKSSQENTDDDDIEIDTFPTDGDPEKLEEAKNEQLKIKKLKTLFKDLKFFINREVPREPLVFIIRCFGGEVSWDKSLFVGSTFDETDETITHQIVDRRNIDKQYISRYYVQPQWIFDSVNARSLLPENKYFMGAILPPHLSPFVDEIRTDHYIPPEERVLKDPSLIQNDDAKEEENESDEESEILSEVDDEENDSGAEIQDNSNECEEQKENEESSENVLVDKRVSKKAKKSNTITPVETQNAKDEIKQTVSEEKPKNKKKKGRKDDKAIEAAESKIREKPKTEAEREKIRQEMLNKMKVKGGEVFKEIPWEQEKIAKQEYRLREKMIEKKHRNLYKSMMEGRKKRAKEIWLLRKKRRLIEEKVKEVKKTTKAVKKSIKSS